MITAIVVAGVNAIVWVVMNAGLLVASLIAYGIFVKNC